MLGGLQALHCRKPGRPAAIVPMQGICKCEHCRGTGRRANWLPLA